jgi:hypothetical protein
MADQRLAITADKDELGYAILPFQPLKRLIMSCSAAASALDVITVPSLSAYALATNGSMLSFYLRKW